MQCNRCRSDPVIFQPYSGRSLCRDHFITDFEVRAKRVIRQHQWMRPGDHIAVPDSGNRADSALLVFLKELACRRRDVQISAILTNRERVEDSGETSWETVAAAAGSTRVALASSLDDIAVSVLTGVLRGLTGPVPASGGPCGERAGTLPRMFPFSGIPANEIVLYAQLKNVGSDNFPPEDSVGGFTGEVKILLDEYNLRHPATKYAVANLGDELAGCGLQVREEYS